jgi:hypothetical protein
MRFIGAHTIRCLLVSAFSLAPIILGLLTACVSAPDRENWIHVGVTTQDEVIARYGQPNWVTTSPQGDTVVYRPTASGSSARRLEIPTAQAGPFGSATTRMQVITPGLGAKDLDGETRERVRREIRIRYNAQGIVQELSAP